MIFFLVLVTGQRGLTDAMSRAQKITITKTKPMIKQGKQITRNASLCLIQE
jgi:hypothetical protein